MSNDKAAATYHPQLFQCPECGTNYVTVLAADACCTDRGYQRGNN